jgi:PhnB protein
MQFMIIVKSGTACEAGVKPGQDVIAAVGNYTQELRRAGVLVELSRLEPSAKGARIRFSAGKPLVIDGPFAETKELIGGYWIIEADSREEAIEWATRVPSRVGDEDTVVEVRQFLGVEYFAPSAALSAAAEPAGERAKFKTGAR